MITVINESQNYFSIDGIDYIKIYQPLKQGEESVGLYNIFDSRQQIVSSTSFEEWTVDGSTFVSQEQLITALNLVTYSPQAILEGIAKGRAVAATVPSGFVAGDYWIADDPDGTTYTNFGGLTADKEDKLYYTGTAWIVIVANATKADIDNLAGAGRTTETVKQNADDIAQNATDIQSNEDRIAINEVDVAALQNKTQYLNVDGSIDSLSAGQTKIIEVDGNDAINVDENEIRASIPLKIQTPTSPTEAARNDQITSLSNDIQSNEDRIAINETDIQNNEDRIAINEVDIAELQDKTQHFSADGSQESFPSGKTKVIEVDGGDQLNVAEDEIRANVSLQVQEPQTPTEAAQNSQITDIKSNYSQNEGNDEYFAVIDGEGNKGTQFDKDGWKSRTYNIVDENNNILYTINAELMQLLVGISESFITNDSGLLYIADESGNVIAKVNGRGIETYNLVLNNALTAKLATLEDLEVQSFLINTFKGVEYYTVGDSLCARNQWQPKFVELTGATFDEAKNIDPTKPLSLGGTQTRGYDEKCGQYRLKNLFEVDPNAKKIILQNINDFNVDPSQYGTIDDDPFMLVNVIFVPDAGLNSLGEAITYWTTNFATIVGAETPTKGSSINIPYNADGENVEVTGVATSNGNVNLNVNGADYSIAVTTGDTIADIVQKIVEINYGLIVDTENANNVSVDFYNPSGSVTVIFTDTDSTGVTMSVTATTTAKAFYSQVYKSEANPTDWADIANWVDFINLYPIYKGQLEYAQTNFPEADIYYFIPDRYGVNLSLYQKPDGTPDIDAYKASADYIRYEQLVGVQKAVCALYKIKVIDVNSESGITLFNFLTYFNQSDVHPKQSGFDRWAETMYKLIK